MQKSLILMIVMSVISMITISMPVHASQSVYYYYYQYPRMTYPGSYSSDGYFYGNPYYYYYTPGIQYYYGNHRYFGW